MSSIHFSSPPEIGHVIRVKVRCRRRCLRLIHAAPYIRKNDGRLSFILHWEDDQGHRYTSGMKGNSVTLAPRGKVARADDRKVWVRELRKQGGRIVWDAAE